MAKVKDKETVGWASYALLILLLIFCMMFVCSLGFLVITIIEGHFNEPLAWVTLLSLAISLLIAGYAALDELRYLKTKKEKDESTRA